MNVRDADLVGGVIMKPDDSDDAPGRTRDERTGTSRRCAARLLRGCR
jgi:hypothetical protein